MTPRMKGLILSACTSLSVCSVSPGQGKHFSLHFYAQPHASSAFPHCVCAPKNVACVPLRNAHICTSRETAPNPHLHPAWRDGNFLPASAPTSGGIWFEQKARAWSKPQPVRTFSPTPVGFSWGSVLDYLQSLLLKKRSGHTLQSTKPLMWSTAY